MKSLVNSIIQFKKILLIPIFLMIISCGVKNKEDDLNSIDSLNTQQNHNIPSFFFLRKGMTYDEVEEYLETNSIKHTDLSTPYWNEDLKNSLKGANDDFNYYSYNYEVLNNYSKARYIKIYDYEIGDIYFDELRLYFIEGIVYKLAYKKLFTDYISYEGLISPEDFSTINDNRIPFSVRQILKELFFQINNLNKESSNSLYLLNSALAKKHGTSNKNNSPNNSFIEDPLKNQYHLSWGDHNNSDLRNIVIKLGNSNQYEEIIRNYDKSNPFIAVRYTLYYYLEVDFTTNFQLLKIKQDKIDRSRIKEEKRKNEIEKQKQKEKAFLDKI